MKTHEIFFFFAWLMINTSFLINPFSFHSSENGLFPQKNTARKRVLLTTQIFTTQIKDSQCPPCAPPKPKIKIEIMPLETVFRGSLTTESLKRFRILAVFNRPMGKQANSGQSQSDRVSWCMHAGIHTAALGCDVVWSQWASVCTYHWPATAGITDRRLLGAQPQPC